MGRRFNCLMRYLNSSAAPMTQGQRAPRMFPGPGCGLLQDGAAPCAPASSAVIDRSSGVLKSRRQSRCFLAGNGRHGRSAIGEIARLECSVWSHWSFGRELLVKAGSGSRRQANKPIFCAVPRYGATRIPTDADHFRTRQSAEAAEQNAK